MNQKAPPTDVMSSEVLDDPGMTFVMGDDGAHLARFLIGGLLMAFGGRSRTIAVIETKRLWEDTKDLEDEENE